MSESGSQIEMAIFRVADRESVKQLAGASDIGLRAACRIAEIVGLQIDEVDRPAA